ncbi:sensor histidine kinase [Myroides sp. LJL119]
METQVITLIGIINSLLAFFGLGLLLTSCVVQKYRVILYNYLIDNPDNDFYKLQTSKLVDSLLPDFHDEVNSDIYKASTFVSMYLIRNKDSDQRFMLFEALQILKELPNKIKSVVLNNSFTQNACYELNSLLGESLARQFEIGGVNYFYKGHNLLENVNREQLHHIYYLTNELVTNILKHSGASWVRVYVISRGYSLVIRIINDGMLFNPFTTTIKSKKGKGIGNIRYRLTQLGADYQYKSVHTVNKLCITIVLS